MSEIKCDEHNDVVDGKEIICDLDLESANANLDEIERKLAQELKLTCDDDGKELDPSQSAPILHNLGKVYHKRGHDDILSYIRSAVLLNAAIVRSTEERKQKVESDLQELCVDILCQAGATKKNVDLLEQAKKVKRQITSMRNYVEEELKNLPPLDFNLHDFTNLPDELKVHLRYRYFMAMLKEKQHELESEKTASIRKLQKSLTAKYTAIMRDLAMFCHVVMYPPPCKFTLIGMGSLARKEITPYSDFENIIVLENKIIHNSDDETKERILQYFRWYSIIFQTVLVNLQETIIPSVAVTSLNDFYHPDKKENNWFFDKFTTRGISFDGMMPYACKFPFGRQQSTKEKPWKTELIKPVNEMLEYLNTDVNLKNGYHLGDILTKVCYVYGDRDIFNEFYQGVAKTLNSQTEEEKIESIKSQLIDDLQNFATKPSLSQIYLNKELNIKKIFYRSTTLFISAMGGLFDIQTSSCFDILERLAQEHKFSDNAKHKLMYGIALACEIRLRWYIRNKCQTDVILPNQNPLETFSSIVGKPSTFSYFQIAYALQCHVSKLLELNKIHFYSKPELLNLSLFCCLYDPRNTNKQLKWDSWDCFTNEQTERLYDFDECLKHLENDITIKVPDTDYHCIPVHGEIYQPLLNVAGNHCSLGDMLLSSDAYDDAKEYFLKSEKILMELKTVTSVFVDRPIDTSCLSNNNSEEAQGFDMQKKLNVDITDAQCDVFIGLGSCCMKLRKHREAINYFQQWLDLREQLPSGYRYRSHTEILSNIALCFMEINEPNKAKINFERALLIQKNEFRDDDPSRNYAETMRKLGLCLLKNNEPCRALKCFQNYLNMREKVFYSDKEDSSLAENFQNIGDCLVAMNRSSEAMKYFEKSWKIEEEISDDETDASLSEVQYKIGSRFLKMNNFDDAIDCFEESLDIKEDSSLNIKTDTSLSKILVGLGKCLLLSGEPEEAKEVFDRVLEIEETASVNAKTDKRFGKTLLCVGKCLSDAFPIDAMKYFDKFLCVMEKASVNPEIDTEFASTLHTISLCLLQLNKFTMAVSYFERSLQIEERVSIDVETDLKFADKLHNVGDSLMDYPDEAIKYFRRYLQILERMSFNIELNTTYAKTLHSIGLCLLKLNHIQEARSNFQRASNIQEHSSVDVETDLACAETKQNIGLCLLKLGKLEDAKTVFGEFSKIYERASLTPEIKACFSRTLNDVGESLLEMKRITDALEYFERSLQIEKTGIQDTEHDLITANTLFNMGKCYLKKNEAIEATKHFERMLQLYKSSSTDFVHPLLVQSLDEIANAFLVNDNPIEAMIHFSKLLQIQELETDDIESDESCAETLHRIGLCCLKLNKATEAMNYLSKSLQIQERLSIDIDSDSTYADTLLHIGLCYLELKNISKALKYFDHSQFIMDRQATSDVEIDGEYFNKLLNVGLRLLKLVDFTDAMKYVGKSLQIKEHISEISKSKSDFAQALQMVGDCLLGMNKSTDAKVYFKKLQLIQNNT